MFLGRYKEHLLKYIDASQLPVFLGGTMIDPVDGGDRCTSLVSFITNNILYQIIMR